MSTLTLTRGLPGAGKTTWARQQPAARVSRDDLRRMLHGGWRGDPDTEAEVTLAQRATVTSLLAAGIDVICDDTNLAPRIVRGLAKLAADCGAEFRVVDFTDVPVAECVRRDALRPPGERVGEPAIRSMWRRYLARGAVIEPGSASPPPGRGRNSAAGPSRGSSDGTPG